MRIEHYSQFVPRDFVFTPDFELEEAITRFDPETKRMLVGRQTKVFGESFSYAGVSKVGTPWEQSKIITQLKNDIEDAFGVDVITCLVGYYPDGSIGIPYHKDVMSDDGIIFNLSLGDARIFRVKWDVTGNVDNYITQNGDVLLFDGEANKHISHDVPVVNGKVKPRWSLTFRTTNKR